MTQSAKSLFQATKPKPDKGPPLGLDLPADLKATAWRNHVWEPALGAGHIAAVLRQEGFEVTGSDIVDRNAGGLVRSFYDFDTPPAPIAITNPPYNEINARDGHGRWLWHSLDLGVPYIALLLNADWCAAQINGMDAIFQRHPPSVEYLCCWKIDFRGGGSPPQRNSWFVWDRSRPAPGPDAWLRTRLYRDMPHGADLFDGAAS